jgi:hypothetical protein
MMIFGFLFAYWKYFYKNKRANELSRAKLLLVAGLRFFAFTFLLLLLLHPRIKYQEKEIIKPTLLFAQDNSSSIVSTKDSLYYQKEYSKRISELIEKLASKFNVHLIQFGNRVKNGREFDFQDSRTDFSDLLANVKDNYLGTKNTQLLISSDGIFNSGANPLYRVQNLGFPVHSLQLGDTSQYKDLFVHSIQSNKIGFTNTKLPVRIGIKAMNLENEEAVLEILDQKKLLFSEKVDLTSNDIYLEKDVFIPLEKPGLRRYTVRLKSQVNEFNLKNNSSSFIVDVLDGKRKIALYFAKYHPDLAAIKSAIEKNENFSVDLIDLRKKPKISYDYNLLILYQVPSYDYKDNTIVKGLIQKKLPAIIFTGIETDYQSQSFKDLGVKVLAKEKLFSNSSFAYNKDFKLYTMEVDLAEEFSQLPPLVSAMGSYQFLLDHQVLAFQKIKSIQTNEPLIALTNKEEQKIAWFFGEGIWRWKQYLYLQNDSHDYFNEMINKLIQYVALKEKRESLLLKHAKAFQQGESILIRAEYYNQLYDLENEKEIDFQLKDEEDQLYRFVFSKDEKAYQLKIDNLPVGKYTYEAKVKDADQVKKGEFYVQKSNWETNQLIANSNLLKQISTLTQGKYFEKDNIEACADYLLQDENTKATVNYVSQYGDFTNWKLLLFLIVMLFVLEWFLLKFWLGI